MYMYVNCKHTNNCIERQRVNYEFCKNGYIWQLFTEDTIHSKLIQSLFTHLTTKTSLMNFDVVAFEVSDFLSNNAEKINTKTVLIWFFSSFK